MQLLFILFDKYKFFINFLFLEIISLCLYISFNSYAITTINEMSYNISGDFYNLKNNFFRILYLEDDNKKLAIENILLKQKLDYYQSKTKIQRPLDTLITNATNFKRQFNYKFATVIKNSVNYSKNYLVIDKGKKEGIIADMGVITSKGVVGIINGSTLKYANVISLLNTKIKINARIKNIGIYGSIIWDGKDPRFVNLIDIPRYQTIKIGQQIETDGKSSVFPEGIPIGKIYKIFKNEESNDYTLKVKLYEDFNKFKTVYIVTNIDKIEIDSLINKQEVVDEKF